MKKLIISFFIFQILIIGFAVGYSYYENYKYGDKECRINLYSGNRMIRSYQAKHRDISWFWMYLGTVKLTDINGFKVLYHDGILVEDQNGISKYISDDFIDMKPKVKIKRGKRK